MSETRGLTKNFGRQAAVDGLDLKVPVGSACGFLGHNGPGKTATDLSGANLNEAKMENVDLFGAILDGARLERVDWSYRAYFFLGVLGPEGQARFDPGVGLAVNLEALAECIYYSVVSFTSIGYSDEARQTWLVRPIAGPLAFIGQFTMVLFVVVFGKWMTRSLASPAGGSLCRPERESDVDRLLTTRNRVRTCGYASVPNIRY